MERDKTESAHGETPEKTKFVGEEDEDFSATPVKELAAAAFIVILSLCVIIPAVRMPKPTTIYTHPGLLPFLIGVSLLLMAVGLGVRAVRMGGAKHFFRLPSKTVGDRLKDVESRRTLLLIGIIIVYVVLVDYIAFDLRLPIGSLVIFFSSYELISIVTLTVILKIYWRASVARCLLVSAGWIVAIASTFRYAFQILLPGLG